jgi:hypothetical protein
VRYPMSDVRIYEYMLHGQMLKHASIFAWSQFHCFRPFCIQVYGHYLKTMNFKLLIGFAINRQSSIINDDRS